MKLILVLLSGSLLFFLATLIRGRAGGLGFRGAEERRPQLDGGDFIISDR